MPYESGQQHERDSAERDEICHAFSKEEYEEDQRIEFEQASECDETITDQSDWKAANAAPTRAYDQQEHDHIHVGSFQRKDRHTREGSKDNDDQADWPAWRR